MRKSNEQTLKEVLQDMVEFYKLRSKLNQTKVQQLWNSMMGQVVSNYTTEIKLRRKKLYVSISSAPLRQELSYGKEKIIKMLNEELGGDFIEDVVIR
jgi:predicted nucleic acid-binding Zn ribbon protein